MRGALLVDPSTQSVAIDAVGRRHAGVAVAFDVTQELTEAVFPLCCNGVPCPTGQFLESVFAVGVKGAFGVAMTLHGDPLTELVAIDRVRMRDAGVTVVFDVTHELAEALLPQVGAWGPCPPGQMLESAFLIGLKGASVVAATLDGDPLTELVAIDRVAHWDERVTVAFDVTQELAKAVLPLGCHGDPCPAWQGFKPVFAVSGRTPLEWRARWLLTH